MAAGGTLAGMNGSRPERKYEFRPLPWTLLPLLIVEGFLALSELFGWFAFNRDSELHAVFTAAIAVAAIVVWLILAAVWRAASWAFRRRFRLSLKTLLAVVTLCAIPCSWIAVETRESRRQREAASAIEREGGHVRWCEPSGPQWLASLLGEDIFAKADMVDFRGSGISDVSLWPLRELNYLEFLYLDGTAITDDGLLNLERLTVLKHVHLGNTQVTDVGIKKLKRALPGCEIYR
jgi:hypothetical protein